MADTNGTSTPPLKHKQLEHVIRTPGRVPSPQPTHLSVPGPGSGSGTPGSGSASPRIMAEQGPGYVAPKFEGKEKQMETVMDMVEAKGFLPVDFVETETTWFYEELGIDDMYFATETADAIASHIHSLYAAKVAAYARDDKKLEIRLDKEAADHAVYIDTSKPGVNDSNSPRYEQRIDSKYLDGSTGNKRFRVESFRSSSKLPEAGGQESQLRCYFVYQCDFPDPNPHPDETRLDVIADRRFRQKATQNTLDVYQEIVNLAVDRTGPVMEVFDIQGKRDKRLVVAYRRGSALGFFR